MSEDKEIKINMDEEPEETASDTPEAEAVGDEDRDEAVEGSEPELSEEEQLRRKLADAEDRLLRAAAEFDNYKKRTTRQFDDIIASANEHLLTELLEVVDNFERAMKHAGPKSDSKSLVEGMDLIYNQLLTLLSKNDVKPIEAVGKTFDPNVHEALLQVDSEDYPEGTVALELTRGYNIGNKVLRYSRVGVSTGDAKDGGEKDMK